MRVLPLGFALAATLAAAGTTFRNGWDLSGNVLIRVSEPNVAELYDLRTGTLLHKLKGHREPIRSTVLSPDGGRALTGAWLQGGKQVQAKECAVILWDVRSGRAIKRFDKAYAPEFCGNGERFLVKTASLSVIGHVDSFTSVTVCDCATGKEVRSFQSTSRETYELSPTGNRLLIYGPLGKCEVRNVDSGKTDHSFTGQIGNDASWDPDEMGIAFTGPRGSSHYDFRTSNLVHLLSALGDEVVRAWSTNGSAALITTLDGRAIVRRMSGDEVVDTCADKEVFDVVDFDRASGRALLQKLSTAYPAMPRGEKRALTVIDLTAGKLTGKLSLPYDTNPYLAPGGKELWVIKGRDDVRILSADTLQETRRVRLKGESATQSK